MLEVVVLIWSRREPSRASSGEPMLSWIRRHLELTPDATDSDFWIARVVARDLGIDTFEVTLCGSG